MKDQANIIFLFSGQMAFQDTLYLHTKFSINERNDSKNINISFQSRQRLNKKVFTIQDF